MQAQMKPQNSVASDGRTKGVSMSLWKRSILTTTLNLCALLVAGYLDSSLAQNANAPVWPTKEWLISTPEAQGMDSAALAKLVAYGEGHRFDSLLIVRHGRIVVEASYALYPGNTPHEIFSATKAVTGTLLAMVYKDGLLDRFDHPMLDFFSDRTIANIDDRKRAEEGLRQVQAELARVARVTTMGELTASIAHEINQPLAAIVASGSACRRWLANEKNLDRARESVERIISDANRASEVIKRVRALTKNKAPERVRVSVNNAIEEVLVFAQAELQAREVSIRRDLDADLPMIIGDKVQLQQVLLNLIVNGIEAMAAITDRRRELVIGSRLDRDGELVISVEDTGTGLDPNHKDRIFDAFFTTKSDGMGMGLSISASIIEAHGGRLWASPGASHGTVFHFALPAVGRMDW